MAGHLAIALSSRFWPMKHQGQTTSDTTSIETVSRSAIPEVLPGLLVLTPPGRQLEAIYRRLVGMLDMGPASNPLVRLVVERHDIGAAEQQPVVGAHRGNELVLRA